MTAILLISILFICVSCTNLSDDEANKILKSRSKLLYFEYGVNENPLKANIILVDINTFQTFNYINNTYPEFGARLSNSGRYIVSFNDHSPHYGKFRIHDLQLNKNWVIELKNLEGKMGAIGITEFAFLNDSTIIIAAIDNFYTFTIQKRAIELLKNTKNKYIYDFIIDSKGQNIAFSFFDNYKTLSETKLALYDIIRDSIIITDYDVFSFGNWNPNSDKFIYTTFTKKNYIFNIGSRINSELIFSPELQNHFGKVLFFSNDTLLVSISQPERKGSDLFLYNTISDQLVSQLTFYPSNKYNIVVFNK